MLALLLRIKTPLRTLSENPLKPLFVLPFVPLFVLPLPSVCDRKSFNSCWDKKPCYPPTHP